jgi:hypothetical protein
LRGVKAFGEEATRMDEMDLLTREAVESLVKDGILEIVGRNEAGEALYALTEFGRNCGAALQTENLDLKN